MLSCGVSDRANERSNTGVGALLGCGVSDVQKTYVFATQCGSNQLQKTHLFASQSAVPKYATKIHIVNFRGSVTFSHNPLHQPAAMDLGRDGKMKQRSHYFFNISMFKMVSDAMLNALIMCFVKFVFHAFVFAIVTGMFVDLDPHGILAQVLISICENDPPLWLKGVVLFPSSRTCLLREPCWNFLFSWISISLCLSPSGVPLFRTIGPSESVLPGAHFLNRSSPVKLYDFERLPRLRIFQHGSNANLTAYDAQIWFWKLQSHSQPSTPQYTF